MLTLNYAPSLFPGINITTPKTQGIKYAGSKLKLLPHIISLLDGLEVQTIFDGFAGTTRVSQAFAQLGYKITLSDISDWSYVLGVCYLQNQNSPSYYNELIEHLNSIKGRDGWFTKHYGGMVGDDDSAIQKDGSKKPWQIHNTRKLDAIRDAIDDLELSEVERAVALTSLLLAMDVVDSTLGHFTSYLKKWSFRSFKDMRLQVPNLFVNDKDNIVIKDDIFNANKIVEADFAYFDPPYGSNNEKMPPSRIRYASYYHLWTTIIKNDKPELFGRAMRRKDSSDRVAASVFEEFRKDESGNYIAVNSIDKLIENANVRYVALSYSSGGRAISEQLNTVLTKHGKLIKTIELDYRKNVMADMKWTNEWLKDTQEPNREFIFLIEK
ncbi:DNA adenine methylase [Candidatus Spongiihabitans sp.]|uniref:DNA adenine methylase n=1 Tax=Candidatus Spongiihabitans sp. TaxID=3101308 RepID=UPI003C6FAF41